MLLVKRFTDQQEIRSIDNTRLRELLNPRCEAGSLHLDYSLAHATVEPRASTRPHLLKTSSEVYYIVEGTGLVHVDGDAAFVGAGDSVYIPPGCIQYIENTSDGHLVFLCIVSPAWQADDEELV